MERQRTNRHREMITPSNIITTMGVTAAGRPDHHDAGAYHRTAEFAGGMAPCLGHSSCGQSYSSGPFWAAEHQEKGLEALNIPGNTHSCSTAAATSPSSSYYGSSASSSSSTETTRFFADDDYHENFHGRDDALAVYDDVDDRSSIMRIGDEPWTCETSQGHDVTRPSMFPVGPPASVTARDSENAVENLEAAMHCGWSRRSLQQQRAAAQQQRAASQQHQQHQHQHQHQQEQQEEEQEEQQEEQQRPCSRRSSIDLSFIWALFHRTKEHQQHGLVNWSAPPAVRGDRAGGQQQRYGGGGISPTLTSSSLETGFERGHGILHHANSQRRHGGPHRSLWETFWTAVGDAFDDASRNAWLRTREMVERLSGAYCRRATRWMGLAAAVNIRDMPVETGASWGRHDSAALIAADIPRLQAEPQDKTAVESILQTFCGMYPGVGYNQGYDSACLAIYLATGRNSNATVPVFAKWAACTGVFMFHHAHGEEEAACEKAAAFARLVLRQHASYVFYWLAMDPVMVDGYDIGDTQTLLANIFLRPLVSLCSRLQFCREVLSDIVDKALDHGNASPIVSLWVATALLCMAAKEDAGRRWTHGEIMSVSKRLDEVSANVSSFQRLEAAACAPLDIFVRGCQDAIAGSSYGFMTV